MPERKKNGNDAEVGAEMRRPNWCECGSLNNVVTVDRGEIDTDAIVRERGENKIINNCVVMLRCYLAEGMMVDLEGQRG